jgi:hypothetical protein
MSSVYFVSTKDESVSACQKGHKYSETSYLRQITVYKQLVVFLLDDKPLSTLLIHWKSRSLCFRSVRRNGFSVTQRSCHYSYCGPLVHDTVCSGRLLPSFSGWIWGQYFPLKRKIYRLTHCTISKSVTDIGMFTALYSYISTWVLHRLYDSYN